MKSKFKSALETKENSSAENGKYNGQLIGFTIHKKN